MILDTWIKQPEERKDYDILYSPWLSPIQDTLNDFEFKIECLTDPLNSSLEIDSSSMTETKLKVWLIGGTDNHKYKLTISATTVFNRIDESEIIVIIKDF